MLAMTNIMQDSVDRYPRADKAMLLLLRFFIGYWIITGLDFYPGLFFICTPPCEVNHQLGNVTKKVVPLPRLLMKVIVPSSNSTYLLTMFRPNPVP